MFKVTDFEYHGRNENIKKFEHAYNEACWNNCCAVIFDEADAEKFRTLATTIAMRKWSRFEIFMCHSVEIFAR